MAAEQRRTGRTYEVDRIVSVGRDRETGGAVIRLKDDEGRTIALRPSNRQTRTLARGLAGFGEALSDE